MPIRLLVPIQSVPGHLVNSIAVTLQDGSNLPNPTLLTTRYTLAEADIEITVA